MLTNLAVEETTDIELTKRMEELTWLRITVLNRKSECELVDELVLTNFTDVQAVLSYSLVDVCVVDGLLVELRRTAVVVISNIWDV